MHAQPQNGHHSSAEEIITVAADLVSGVEPGQLLERMSWIHIHGVSSVRRACRAL